FLQPRALDLVVDPRLQEGGEIRVEGQRFYRRELQSGGRRGNAGYGRGRRHNGGRRRRRRGGSLGRGRELAPRPARKRKAFGAAAFGRHRLRPPAASPRRTSSPS